MSGRRFAWTVAGIIFMVPVAAFLTLLVVSIVGDIIAAVGGWNDPSVLIVGMFLGVIACTLVGAWCFAKAELS